RHGRPRAATNPLGTWGLRPHASFLVVNDATTSFPPRASPGTRKPHVRGPCYYSDTLLVWGQGDFHGEGDRRIGERRREGRKDRLVDRRQDRSVHRVVAARDQDLHVGHPSAAGQGQAELD